MAYISNDPNEGIRQVSGQAIPSGGINSFTSPGNEFVNARRRAHNAYWNQSPREPDKRKAKLPAKPTLDSLKSPPVLIARPGMFDMGDTPPSVLYSVDRQPTAVPGKPVPVKTNPIATTTVAAPPAPPAKPATPPTPPVKRGGLNDYGAESGGYGPSKYLYDTEGNTKKQAAADAKKREAAEGEKFLEAQRAKAALELKYKQAHQGDPSPERDVNLKFEKLRESRQANIEAQLAARRKEELQKQMDAERTIDEFKKSLEQENMDKFMANLRGPQSMTVADRDRFDPSFVKVSDKYNKQRRYKATSSSRADEDEENRRLMQAERVGDLLPLQMNMKLARMARNARKTKEASPGEY